MFVLKNPKTIFIIIQGGKMLKKTIEDDIAIVMLENGKTNPITLDLLKELQEIIHEVNGKGSACH